MMGKNSAKSDLSVVKRDVYVRLLEGANDVYFRGNDPTWIEALQGIRLETIG
jgi:hypothetical protein